MSAPLNSITKDCLKGNCMSISQIGVFVENHPVMWLVLDAFVEANVVRSAWLLYERYGRLWTGSLSGR